MFEFAGEKGIQRANEYSEALRNRVVEIMEALGTRVPVYVVFTMCDLMEGFVDFFSELTPEEIDAWWGVTLEPNMMAKPGDLSNFDAAGSFDTGFDAIKNRLQNRRFSPVQRAPESPCPVTPRSSSRTTCFRCESPFACSSKNSSAPPAFDDDLLFRGFYFTSGTQTERPPVDLSRSLSSILGLSAAAGATMNDSGIHYPERKNTHSYFVRNLFLRRDASRPHLAHPTTKSAKRRINMTYLAATLALVVLSGWAFFSAGLQSSAKRAELQSVMRCESHPAPTTPRDLQSNINDLYEITTSRAALGKSRFSFGIDRVDEEFTTRWATCETRFQDNVRFLYNEVLYPQIGRVAALPSGASVPNSTRRMLRAALLLGQQRFNTRSRNSTRRTTPLKI